MTLRKRITQRLNDLNMSARSASLAAGLNTHFLKQFLAEESKSMRVDSLQQIAEVLETTTEWLMHGNEQAEIINIWSRIPEEKKPVYKEILESGAEDKTG